MQAASGAEFIAGLQRLEQPPDLCLCNHTIKGQTNSHYFRELRAVVPKCPLLAIIPYKISDVGIRLLLSLKVNGFLGHELEAHELKAGLITAYKTGYYIPPAILMNLNLSRNREESLTEKDFLRLSLFFSDMTCHEIAAHLFVSERTVHDYREQLFNKLGLIKRTREGLMVYAARMGILPFETGPH